MEAWEYMELYKLEDIDDIPYNTDEQLEAIYEEWTVI